jgi:hypothetical protein
MKLLISISLFFLYSYVYCQKPIIDSSCFSWPEVDYRAFITNNGEYSFCKINNFSHNLANHIFQKINGNWKKSILCQYITNLTLTSNNMYACFIRAGDTLSIIRFGEDEELNIPEVKSYQCPTRNQSQWIAYQFKGSNQELHVKNLFSNQDFKFDSVENYLFSQNGKRMAVLTKSGNLTKLVLILLNNYSIERRYEIWNGLSASNLAFDSSGNRLIFNGNVSNRKSLWLFDGIKDSITDLWDDTNSGLLEEMVISENRAMRFSDDGSRVFLLMTEKENKKTNKNLAPVDIWHYKDIKTQQQQLEELKNSKLFKAVLNLDSKKIIRLEYECDKSLAHPIFHNDNHFMIIYSNCGDIFESFWNNAARGSVSLVSTKDGSRTLLGSDLKEPYPYYILSNYSKYVIYYDSRSKNYFSFEIKTGKRTNLTKGINTTWVNDKSGRLLANFQPIGIGGWLEKDSLVFIYDKLGIWLFDPSGKSKPKKFAVPGGQNPNIAFRFTFDFTGVPIKKSEDILLAAFDYNSKYNGFYHRFLNDESKLEKLTMGPYVYYWPEISIYRPVKSKDNSAFLVRRMSVSEAPNWFSTNDFKNLHPLTNNNPHSTYNWISSEIVKWKTFDNSTSQGIIYKPENFDVKKKYPMIMVLYENFSNTLNSYYFPQASNSTLNIVQFVSNGYLVFCPDIKYKIGNPGESVYNSAGSAIKYFARKQWVDIKAIGVYGHSFGSYEVNYLITRTHSFAAAISACGVSNLVSFYTAGQYGYMNSFSYLENDQGRMGKNLWDAKSDYIKNSPLFYTNKITTPVLLLNNKGDERNYQQGLEFFSSLRRLGKRAWMLQYDDSDHSVDFRSAPDYELRITQYFDHFLKGKEAPVWLLEGIPAKHKGIKSGFEYKSN